MALAGTRREGTKMSKPPDAKHGKVKDGKTLLGAENKRLTAQTRKILGKHYANKYRTKRG